MKTLILLSFCIILGHAALFAADGAMQTLQDTDSVIISTKSLSETEPEPITITARPRFEKQGEDRYLIIEDALRSYEIHWPPMKGALLAPLNTGRVYKFTVVEVNEIRLGEFTMVVPDQRWPVLRRIERDGETVYDIGFCEVHKTRMEYKEVPVFAGYLSSDPTKPWPETEKRLFPHRREYYWTGSCLGTPVKSIQIYVCSECKAAYQQWKIDNPSGDPARARFQSTD